MTLKALLLLSGGMDSSTYLYYLLDRFNYDEIVALSINYGQRHSKEIDAAVRIAKIAGARWLYVSAPLKHLWAPLLGDGPIPMQSDRNQGATVVPARNAFLLSIAAGVAMQEGCNDIHYAAVMDDFTSYPDCRPSFIAHLHDAFVAGYGVSVHALFQSLFKVEIARIGLALDVPFEETWTCYLGGETPCLLCDACSERLMAFASLERDYNGKIIDVHATVR